MPAMNYFLTIYEDLGKLTFYLLLQVGLLVSKYEDLGQLRADNSTGLDVLTKLINYIAVPGSDRRKKNLRKM
jgi:hypothetical protein